MLADDFFRLAHHDVTGRPRLHSAAVSTGLAAALLAELLSAGHIHIQAGAVLVVNRAAPADALGQVVLNQLLLEPGQYGVRTWLEFLGRTSTERVARRLARAGHLRAATSRRPVRQRVTYVPVDMNTAAMPWALLSTRLRRGEPLSHHQACLAGLAAATGHDAFLLDGAPPQAANHLDRTVATLWPAMRELLHHTSTAIGDAVLTHRA